MMWIRVAVMGMMLSGWAFGGYSYWHLTTHTTTTIAMEADPECAAWRAEQKRQFLTATPEPNGQQAPYQPRGAVLGLGTTP